MASTKTTTRIKPARFGVAALCAALIVFSLLNLSQNMTPVAKNNEQIDNIVERDEALTPDARMELFRRLKIQQEANLARKPSEPYGWSRLSYLRFMTEQDQKSAFAALRMSDFVSPYEAPQLPERALMWYKFHNVETLAQKTHQDILWQRAYGLERDATWRIAVRNGLVEQVGESLKKTAPAFYREWKARQQNEDR